MSIELKQAAQDAAEAIDWLLKNIRLDAPQLSGKAMGNAEKCASALRAALSKQPATPDPVVSRNPFAARCYTMSESHLSGHRLIVGFEKLGDAQDAHEWVTRQGRGDFTRPAPSVPNDHQIAALVNKVRDIARTFHDHQSLRERIAIELVPALKVSQEAKSDAERGRFLIEWLKRYGLLQAEFGQMGVGEKPENWWLLHAPWGIDKTRPFFGHGKTQEQAIDAAMLAAKEGL